MMTRDTEIVVDDDDKKDNSGVVGLVLYIMSVLYDLSSLFESVLRSIL